MDDVDIVDLQDLATEGVEARPAERAGGEALDMGICNAEFPAAEIRLSDHLQHTDRQCDPDQNRIPVYLLDGDGDLRRGPHHVASTGMEKQLRPDASTLAPCPGSLANAERRRIGRLTSNTY
ncbi:hypothetical protein ABZT49_11255 [Methylobacterium sp. EM32]|uniref:hypothetical protein n=1 Tax=Methylobacterium sp. EM32 TaxID=3163481 RepID=UPI0033A40281